MLRSTLLVLTLSLALTGCASSFTYPNATPAAPRTITAFESKPEGPGPFPAVVLMHGCHGVSRSTHEWAKWFSARGYVALIVDSWGPRGIKDGCIPGPDIPSTERFDDAVGGLRWLHSRPYVDARHVGIVGWSNGGVFAMSVINGPSLERARKRGVVMPDPGFMAGIGFYPGGCYSLVKEQVVRPLLVLLGDADDWTSPSECSEMVEAMRAKGADAALVLYPGAVHYFDVEYQPRVVIPEVENRNRPGGCCGATVGFDADANADARQRVEAFFGRHLKGR